VTNPPPKKGALAWVERVGNALPDPVFLFFGLITVLIVVSVGAGQLGWATTHPATGEAVAAKSLLSAENLEKLLVEMPTTFAHFHPLGYVLVVMLGAGVAERAGLFGSAMRAIVAPAPAALLTPVVAAAAMMGNLAADAAYVVLVPLAGLLYAAAGRHPLLGIITAFAGVSGGFSANLLVGQLDALLFGITESGAEILDPDWNANIAGNWYFIIGMFVTFLPVIWLVSDRIVEPRLGRWDGGTTPEDGDSDAHPAPANEGRALAAAGVAALAVALAWVAMVVGPGAPLVDADAALAEARLTPFYKSLVAGFFVLFLASGWAFGWVAGTIRGHRDVVKMMASSMQELGYYLVLAFVAAHFVAMFNWSNLGLLLAIQGASALKATGAPAPVLLAGIVVLAATVNLVIGSASAKWALLAPILVPMLMLLGISPEMTTAAYRVGDSATNIATPLMVYFPLVLSFCQRWKPDYGLGSLLSHMLPYSFWLLLAGLALTFGWVLLDLPLGPGASIHYSP
jgi:aminobenzoyl-glutamate transport protein